MIVLTPLFQQMLPSVKCFSTTRHGGYSEGNYASTNCNLYCGDNIVHVERNRGLICKQLGITMKQLVIPHQIHSSNVAVIDDSYLYMDEKKKIKYLEGVDAIVTRIEEQCLCISTADCVPVMLFDEKNRVIVAIHAGWRGTLKCIVSHAIDVISEKFGTEGRYIHAAIGPSISFDNFEVGDEVYEAFDKANFPMAFIARRLPSMMGNPEEKWHIDLWQANRLQLLSRGVLSKNINILGICTYQHYIDYYSARRMGVDSGRTLSGIMLQHS